MSLQCENNMSGSLCQGRTIWTNEVAALLVICRP